MPLLPTGTPAADPGAEAVLRPRWARARRLLSLSVAMPWLVALACAATSALASAGWWSALLVAGAVLPAVGHALAVRHDVLRPASWVRHAFLASGVQFLVGVIPCLGVAANAPSGAGRVSSGVLFVLALVCGAVSVVAARRALTALLAPLVPELGATPFRLTVGVRYAVTAPAPVSAHLDIDVDRIGWRARWHRGRDTGPQVAVAVRFAELVGVEPVMLPGEPALRPWVTLPDGTVLYAQPGPALVLHTANRRWLVPVHDALLLAELVNRRRLVRLPGI